METETGSGDKEGKQEEGKVKIIKMQCVFIPISKRSIIIRYHQGYANLCTYLQYCHLHPTTCVTHTGDRRREAHSCLHIITTCPGLTQSVGKREEKPRYTIPARSTPGFSTARCSRSDNQKTKVIENKTNTQEESFTPELKF